MTMPPPGGPLRVQEADNCGGDKLLVSRLAIRKAIVREFMDGQSTANLSQQWLVSVGTVEMMIREEMT